MLRLIPPYGAIFTFYLKNNYTTLKQQRKNQERAAVRANKNIEFPTWEGLKAEDLSETPSILLMIKDSEGNLIRTIRGANRAGFQRFNWDLRYSGGASRGRFGGSGPMAAPGDYSATLYKMMDNELIQLSESQRFTILPLGLTTLPAPDAQVKLEFLQNTGKLQRVMMGTLQYVQNKLQELGDIKNAVMNSSNVDVNILKQIQQLELQLQELRLAMIGDETRSNRGEFVAPSIMDRVRDAMSSGNNSAPVTETHKHNVEIASKAFENIYNQVKKLDIEDIAKLHQSLKTNQIKWSPNGALPEWTK
ncbi:MAG: hypothetical protein IPJ74_19960 [Saprospiraceae bacterium]|nr:hypothetical protein [Saprospiraceae bacterium]